MNADTERAKALLETSGCTCVFCAGALLEQSSERGIRPLLAHVDGTPLPARFSAADKVVGRAPAFLYILLGAGEVYASVMTRGAKTLLEENGISAFAGLLTDEIRNRSDTGPCPMEAAVRPATGPEDALRRIREAVRAMRGGK